MPSIAEVFVTVFPSEPVDTTSPYKNVLRPALAADGLPASRPRDYRTGWYPRTRRSGRSASRPMAYRSREFPGTFASLPREPIWQGIKRERHFVVRCLFESSH